MFGIGIEQVFQNGKKQLTSLIASAFTLVLEFSITINSINIGLFPARIGLVEWVYSARELPLVMIVEAFVYEGANEPERALGGMTKLLV